MLKLPSGYGCDAGDSGDEGSSGSRGARAGSSDGGYPAPQPSPPPSQYHNLPVAVAVPMSGGAVPNLQRQRSLNGAGANVGPVRRKTAHQFSFRSLTGSEFIRLADYAGKVRCTG